MTSIIRSEQDVQRRSNKHPETDTPSFDTFDVDFVTQNTNSIRKKTRKTSQLSQFHVFEDKILSADRENSSGQNESTPNLIGFQTDKIWSHISVNISFRPEFHSILNLTAVQSSSREPLISLSCIALNDTQKTPQISRK